MKLKIELELDEHPTLFIRDGEVAQCLSAVAKLVESNEDLEHPRTPIIYKEKNVGFWSVE